jgi:hypothetical protein
VIIAVREHPELDGLPLHQAARLVIARVTAEHVVIVAHRYPRYSNRRVNFEGHHVAEIIRKRHRSPPVIE